MLQAIGVARDARLDDRDIGLEAREFGLRVFESAHCLGASAANRDVSGGEVCQRGSLGKRAEPVSELLQPGVERLESQQLLLIGWAGLHVVLLEGIGC